MQVLGHSELAGISLGMTGHVHGNGEYHRIVLFHKVWSVDYLYPLPPEMLVKNRVLGPTIRKAYQNLKESGNLHYKIESLGYS